MTLRTASLLFAALPLAGCGAESPGPLATTFAAPALVTADGAQPGSRVTAHRSGPLDPNGSDVDVKITAARVRLRTSESAVTVEELVLEMADFDIPATKTVPGGLMLREQRLVAPRHLKAETLRRTADELDVRLTGKLVYHSSMLLSDGSLAELGASDVEGPGLEVHLSRVGSDGTSVVMDAPPGGVCTSIGDLLTLSGCALFVESTGSIAMSPQ